MRGFTWSSLLSGRKKPIEIEYIGKGGGKNKYFEANAIKFTDKGCYFAFEVIVNSSATAPNENQKGIKFGGWWEPVPYLYRREVTIKNVKDGQHVWIRCIGSKKYSWMWMSPYVELGVVDFPYTIPAK